MAGVRRLMPASYFWICCGVTPPDPARSVWLRPIASRRSRSRRPSATSTGSRLRRRGDGCSPALGSNDISDQLRWRGKRSFRESPSVTTAPTSRSFSLGEVDQTQAGVRDPPSAKRSCPQGVERAGRPLRRSARGSGGSMAPSAGLAVLRSVVVRLDTPRFPGRARSPRGMMTTRVEALLAASLDLPTLGRHRLPNGGMRHAIGGTGRHRGSHR